MKDKKLILAAVALIAVIAVMLGVYALTRPKTRAELTQKEPAVQQETSEQTGEASPEATTDTTVSTVSISVVVIHKDGTEKEFLLETDALYLGEVLIAEGIVEGESGPYGLVINSVDGETADWNVDQSYWAIFIGEEYATTGADGIPVYDDGVYKLVYTIG